MSEDDASSAATTRTPNLVDAPSPGPSPLNNPAMGSNFFQIELLIHKDGKKDGIMKPFESVNVRDERKGEGLLTIDRYAASPGMKFSIRVRLGRPVTNISNYGARVYIDSGKETAKQKTVFRYWWSPEDHDPEMPTPTIDNQQSPDNQSPDEPKPLDPKKEDVDTSKANHAFWFIPGEREHTINGFYKTATTSRAFLFAEAKEKESKKRAHPGDGDGPELDERNEALDDDDENSDVGDAHGLGVIRIVFCRLERCVPRRDPQRGSFFAPRKLCKPKDSKVTLVAAPGATINDGNAAGLQEPILSNKIIHERRIVYSTSYRGSAKTQKNIDFFRGMPLNAFSEDGIRSQAISLFVQEAHKKKKVPPISFVGVGEVCDCICDSLSPAASYLVCTGDHHREQGRYGKRNYGESLIQNLEASDEEKKKDYDAKAKRLLTWFQGEPDSFELKSLPGIDSADLDWKSIQVRHCVLDLTGDDSE